MPGSRRGGRAQLLRYLVVGAANTLGSYAIFILLGLVIAPWLAYTIAFACGFLWVLFGTTRIVFDSAAPRWRIAAFGLAYLAVFGIGQLLIRLLDPEGLGPLLVTSAIVLCVTTPATFLIGRWLLAPTPAPGAADEGERR